MQRSHGKAMVSFDLRAGRAGLRDLAQSGSAKAMLPRVWGAVPEVVFLNTSGGLTGGDTLSFDMALGAGVHMAVLSLAYLLLGWSFLAGEIAATAVSYAEEGAHVRVILEAPGGYEVPVPEGWKLRKVIGKGKGQPAASVLVRKAAE